MCSWKTLCSCHCRDSRNVKKGILRYLEETEGFVCAFVYLGGCLHGLIAGKKVKILEFAVNNRIFTSEVFNVIFVRDFIF